MKIGDEVRVAPCCFLHSKADTRSYSITAILRSLASTNAVEVVVV